MVFTDDELFEIEKIFDCSASAIQMQMVKILNSVATVSKEKAQKYCDQVFESYVKSYDIMRTISAKCQGIRLKK